VDKPILLFGRHEECDIQLNSKKISRRHCCLAIVNDYLVVRDLGSTNGVKINGVKVVEGKLHLGDELQIGGFKFEITGEIRPVTGNMKENFPAKNVDPEPESVVDEDAG